MCILPINIVNQKIFLGCWFLFILLILLSGAKIIFSLFLFLLPSLRYFLLRFLFYFLPFSYNVDPLQFWAGFRIRIRIHMFVGLLDPDPDPLVRGMDPYPSVIQQNSK
jgi:hypothetical protein